MALVLITPSGVLGQANAPTKPPKDIKPIKVSDEEYKLGKLSFNPKTREIWFPCRVNQNEVVLEFAICDEFRGKLHESLLSTKVTPFEIQIAMKLLRWEPSGGIFTASSMSRAGRSVSLKMTARGAWQS